jgi:hypothetical protein
MAKPVPHAGRGIPQDQSPRRAMRCTCDMPDGVGWCDLHDLEEVIRDTLRDNRAIWRPWEDNDIY